MEPSSDVERRRFLISLCGVGAGTAALPCAGQPKAAAGPFTTQDRIDLALMWFRSGYHCSQSVLAAYADELGIETDLALKLAAGLAGGSTVGGECGTVAAGYLLLGVRHGRETPAGGDVQKEEALFGRIRRLVELFKQKHGSINCRELLGVDVFTAEGRQEARRRNLYSSRCPNYIRDTISILESLR